MRTKTSRTRDAGFTLVEMIIAVVIIGVLAAIAIPVYSGIQHRAKVAAVETSATNSYIEIYAVVANGGDYAARAKSLSSSDIVVTVNTDGYKDNTQVVAKWKKDPKIVATRGSYEEPL